MDMKDNGMMDKMKSAGNELKGDMKEGLGKMMNDKGMQVDGKVDKAKAFVQDKVGDAKNAMNEREERQDRRDLNANN